MSLIHADPAISARAEDLLKRSQVLHLALANQDQPYLVPLSFGYADGCLYFHSGPHGRKLEMLAINPQVCFEVEEGIGVVPADLACNFNMRFLSLIGFGKAIRLTTSAEKRAGLDVIVRQYGGEPPDYDEKRVTALEVVKIEIQSINLREVNP